MQQFCSRWFRRGSGSLGVEDSAESVAEHDLFRCNLEGREIGQVLFEAPLRLESSRNGHRHVEYELISIVVAVCLHIR